MIRKPRRRGRDVYRSFDILSPWTVGRFRDDESVDRFYREEVAPDLTETNRLGLEYMPVVFPGFSWHNMNPTAPSNPIPRRGGRFFWHQIERALQAGATMVYAAMFDEVDEGTAMFKLAPTHDSVPGRRATGHARRRWRGPAERLVPAAGASGTATTIGYRAMIEDHDHDRSRQTQDGEAYTSVDGVATLDGIR